MKQPNLAVNNSLDIQKVYRELYVYCYRIDKYGKV